MLVSSTNENSYIVPYVDRMFTQNNVFANYYRIYDVLQVVTQYTLDGQCHHCPQHHRASMYFSIP